MFWISFTYGINTLFTNWDIWVFILSYVFLIRVFRLLFEPIMAGLEEPSIKITFSKFVTFAISIIVLAVIPVSFIVASILPILCGGNEFLPIHFLVGNFWLILKSSLFTLIVILVLGGMSKNLKKSILSSPSFIIFIQGVVSVGVKEKDGTLII
jgi:hypothetical protein